MNDLPEELVQQMKAVRDAAVLPELDPSRLLDIANRMRARHRDPASEFANRPDLIAASELQIQAQLMRAGVTEAPVTPQSLAEGQHNAAWTMSELNPGIKELVADRVAAAEKLPPYEQTLNVADAKKELGADYDRLVADCGPSLPAAALGDVYTIKTLAAHGRYRAAAAAARSKF